MCVSPCSPRVGSAPDGKQGIYLGLTVYRSIAVMGGGAARARQLLWPLGQWQPRLGPVLKLFVRDEAAMFFV